MALPTIDTNSTVHGDDGQIGRGMNPATTGKRRRPSEAGAPKARGTSPPRRWGWILQPRRWHVPGPRIWTVQRFERRSITVPVPIERGRG